MENCSSKIRARTNEPFKSVLHEKPCTAIAKPDPNQSCEEEDKSADEEISICKDPISNVLLLKPIEKCCKPTVFCKYPKASQKERSTENAYQPTKAKVIAKFKMTNCVRYAAILAAFKAAGFEETEGSDWNLLWSAPVKSDTLKVFTKYQKCNHFPSAWQLGRKNNMWVNYMKMKRLYPLDYDYCPQTYLFPDDFPRFQIEREANMEHMYIMKPVASACGKGIKVFGKNQAIPKKR